MMSLSACEPEARTDCRWGEGEKGVWIGIEGGAPKNWWQKKKKRTSNNNKRLYKPVNNGESISKESFLSSKN